MKDHADRLAHDRALRDEARTLFLARIEALRADLRERGIGRRAAAALARETREAVDEAIEIASDSKGVVAATIAALMLWLFRNPIAAMVQGLFDTDDDDVAPTDEEEQA